MFRSILASAAVVAGLAQAVPANSADPFVRWAKSVEGAAWCVKGAHRCAEVGDRAQETAPGVWMVEGMTGTARIEGRSLFRQSPGRKWDCWTDRGDAPPILCCVFLPRTQG